MLDARSNNIGDLLSLQQKDSEMKMNAGTFHIGNYKVGKMGTSYYVWNEKYVIDIVLKDVKKKDDIVYIKQQAYMAICKKHKELGIAPPPPPSS